MMRFAFLRAVVFNLIGPAFALFGAAQAQVTGTLQDNKIPAARDLIVRPDLVAKLPAPELDFFAERKAGAAVRLQLDRAFYDIGDTVKATLEFAAIDPAEKHLLVHVVSEGGDVEFIILKKTRPRVYETEASRVKIAALGGGGKSPADGLKKEPLKKEPIKRIDPRLQQDNPLAKRQAGQGKQHDGVLETRPGDQLTGVVFLNKKTMPVGVDVIADVAIAGTDSANLPRLDIEPRAMSEGEKAAQGSKFPYGMVMARGGWPLEIAMGQVLFTPVGMADLNRFLAYSGGTVIDAMPLEDRDPNFVAAVLPPAAMTYLVEVPLSRARTDRLADLRAVFEEKQDVIASQPAALQTYALVFEYRLKGFAVAANPRLQQHGSFSTIETRGPVLLDSMKLGDRTGGACAPTDPTCPLTVQKLWADMALWDLDGVEVPVAFLDQGFATASPDFRRPASGAPFVECDFERIPPVCAPGVANTPPTVGASLVGPRVWHGTGSVATAGGVLNNGWTPGSGVADRGGSAGPGGQVLVPMMYRMGFGSYAFQMGQAMRRATDDGAACINVAAGYPCNLSLTLVGNFELCNPAVRAAACGALIAATSAAAATASAAACTTSGFLGGLIDAFLPGLGSVIAGTTCAAVTASGTAAVVAVTHACGALVALGDVRGPMQAGVDHATRRGVPVIASMGNQFNAMMVPPEVRPFIDPATFAMNGDQLQVIPAVLNPVISIGAATPTGAGGAWVNSHIRGPSVSVWAPEDANYITPPIGGALPTGPAGFTAQTGHGGTSSASSYVTGIVAAMQAANPALNPRTPGLTAAQRRAIPDAIERMLRETATELGTGPAEPARLPMVNAIAALQRAAPSRPFGFDTQLNFDEAAADDDVAARARNLLRATEVSGTIISIPGGDGGVATQNDVDFYRVRPSSTSTRGATFTVTLTYPEEHRGAAMGRIRIDGAGWRETDNRTSTTGSGAALTVLRRITYSSDSVGPGSSTTLRVAGVGNEDNVYKLIMAEFPLIDPDRFDLDNSSNLLASRPNNNVAGRAVPIGVDGGLAWTDRRFGVGGYSELNIPNLSFHESSDEDWFVFRGFPTGSGSGTAPGCRSALTFPAQASVRVELFSGGSLTLLSPVREGSPARTVYRIPAPSEGLTLRFTREPTSLANTYALDLRFDHAPPPGGPFCR